MYKNLLRYYNYFKRFCFRYKDGLKATDKTSKGFWKAYNNLPKDIQKQADQAYKLYLQNPNHPGLNFEKLAGGKYYSIRIN